MLSVIKLLRIHQYIKNLLVFAPLFFSFNFGWNELQNASIAFFIFCLLTSGVYVFNDLMDIKSDKNHPVKKHRPLASGAVSPQTGKTLIIIFSIFPLLFAFFINTNLFIILGIYLILNIAYSVKLKHLAIIDLFIIAVGFLLRLFAGSIMINTDLSMWIIIMTFLLALFLGLAKRRSDVLLSLRNMKVRKNIDGYKHAKTIDFCFR